MRHRRTLAVVGLLLLLGTSPAATARERFDATAPSPAPTPAPGGVSIVPSAKSTHTNPTHTAIRVGTLPVGQPFEDHAVVVNTGDVPIDVYLYPADGSPARGGGYGYAVRNAPRLEVGAWLAISTDRATIAPHGRLPLTLSLVVPANATNGFHVGAVIAEPVNSGTGTFRSITRFAMPVSLTVTGGLAPTPTPGAGSAAPTPMASPAPGSPQRGPLTLAHLRVQPHGSRVCATVQATNISYAEVSPQLELSSSGWFGGSSHPVTAAPLPARTSLQVPLGCVRRPLGPGKFRVRVVSPTSDAAAGAQLFWAPVPFLLSLLLLLLLLAALLTTVSRGWRRRRNRDDAATAASPSSKGLDNNHPQ